MALINTAANGFQRDFQTRKPPGNMQSQNSQQPKTDFDSLRTECLQNGALYEDPDFPPLDSSIYYSCKPNQQFEWLRPHEIAGRFGLNPELHIPGSRYNLVQGVIGDYWLLQAATCLYDNHEQMRHVIPGSQSFSKSWYAGIFRFHFWRYGRWQEVIIDDRLPTVRGEMACIHSREPHEFWGALLEKAYAKLHGSYESMKSGFLSNALHGITGGVVETYQLINNTIPLPVNIVNGLFKAMERHTIILAHVKAIPGRPAGGVVLHNGLIAGRVYSVTDIREIKLVSDEGEVPITLVRLANPWGERIMWSGPWGERSTEWTSIPPYDRQAMGLVCRENAEFWMDFRDFLRTFDTLDMCHQLPDIVPLASPPRVWRGLQFHGRWWKGVNSGGRPICVATHHLNPQYHIRLTKSDEDETRKCTCLVELTQKDRRKHILRGRVSVDIGFVLYKCSNEDVMPLTRQYLDHNTFHDRCDFFANGEQVTKRFLLEVGDYVIIPSTYLADTEADFMLRVLLEEDNHVELVEEWSENTLTPIPALDIGPKERENVLNTYLDMADGDMEIDVFQLREILHRSFQLEAHNLPLSKTACKKLVSLKDTEGLGRIGYHEYLYIWNNLCQWKRIFQNCDDNSTGAITVYALRPSLGSLGYHLTNEVASRLVLRFVDENNLITFSGFVECLCKLLSIIDTFKAREDNGLVTFTSEQFLKVAVVI